MLLVLSYDGIAHALATGRVSLAALESPHTLFVFEESDNIVLGALGNEGNAFHRLFGFTPYARSLDTAFKHVLMKADREGRALYRIGRSRQSITRRGDFLAKHGWCPATGRLIAGPIRVRPRPLRRNVPLHISKRQTRSRAFAD